MTTITAYPTTVPAAHAAGLHDAERVVSACTPVVPCWHLDQVAAEVRAAYRAGRAGQPCPEAPVTVVTEDGRVWEAPAAAQNCPDGVIHLDFRCGRNRATLFKARASKAARFLTASGKRLVVIATSLPGAILTANGNVEVAS